MAVQTDPRVPLVSFIADFVASNRIADARALLASIPEDERTAGDLAAWVTVLAEPKVTTRPEADSDRRHDLEWLRLHATEFEGRWVALRGGALIAAGDSLREILACLDRSGGRIGVLVHKV